MNKRWTRVARSLHTSQWLNIFPNASSLHVKWLNILFWFESIFRFASPKMFIILFWIVTLIDSRRQWSEILIKICHLRRTIHMLTNIEFKLDSYHGHLKSSNYHTSIRFTFSVLDKDRVGQCILCHTAHQHKESFCFMIHAFRLQHLYLKSISSQILISINSSRIQWPAMPSIILPRS